ncbi:MAG: ABC transporter permease [Lentisphaeria bacterium]|nr:ABC transporter permease [Lentisphaeria bacterium]
MKQERLLIRQTGERVFQFAGELRNFVFFTGELLYSLGQAIRHPGKIRWADTLRCMNICGADGLPITFLICYLAGIIIGYQAAVQMQKYGADSFLPGLVGCTMARELAPLLVAVIATGRCGSAFAAEIGTMKVYEEIDAMRTMGLNPCRFLVIPKILAMIAMIPLLTVFGDLAGVLGGLTVGRTQLGMPLEVYMQTTFIWIKYKYFLEGIFKSVIFGIIITVVGCFRGFQTGSDAAAVGKATTQAVVSSILTIIITDAILAHLFNTIFFAG